jgi:tetratricopeptide (TPR) repeat protein
LRLDALNRASGLARVTGDAGAAAEYAAAAVALAREVQDAPALAAALTALGEAIIHGGDYERGISIHEEALSVARESGRTPVPILTNLADAALAAGQAERAIEYSTHAAGLADGPDKDTVRTIAAFNIASALIQLDRGDEARPHLEEALDGVLELDYPELLGWCLAAAAAVAVSAEARDAAVLLGAAEALMDSVGVAFGRPSSGSGRSFSRSFASGRPTSRARSWWTPAGRSRSKTPWPWPDASWNNPPRWQRDVALSRCLSDHVPYAGATARHGHLPLHRHRGLDAAARRAG